MNAQENRTESGNPTPFASATAIFLVVLVMGYTVSTQVESAVDVPPPPATTTAQPDSVPAPVPAPYFPAQFVNQGTVVEEHIQAF